MLNDTWHGMIQSFISHVQECRLVLDFVGILLSLNSWQHAQALFLFFQIQDLTSRLFTESMWRDSVHLSLIQVFISSTF